MFEVLIFFIASVVIGLLVTFFGYAFFRVLLPIWAFLAGLMFGYNGLSALFGPGILSATSGIVLGLFVGIVLAIAAYFLYSLAVYWFGLAVGYILGVGVMMALGFDYGFLSVLVGILTAIALVVLFVATSMPKAFIIVLTAAAGAMATIMGIFVLFGEAPEVAASLQLTALIVSGSWFWMIIWIALAAFGMVFQFALAQQAEDLSEPYDWGTQPSKKKKR